MRFCIRVCIDESLYDSEFLVAVAIFISTAELLSTVTIIMAAMMR